MIDEDGDFGHHLQVYRSGYLAIPEVDDVQEHEHRLLVAVVVDSDVMTAVWFKPVTRAICAEKHSSEYR